MINPIKLKLTDADQPNQLNKQLTFEVLADIQSISFQIDDINSMWGTLFVYDASGNLRVQYVTGKAPQPIIVHEKTEQTSPYAITGEISPGIWTVELLGETKQDNEKELFLSIRFNEECQHTLTDEVSWIEPSSTKLQLSNQDDDSIVRKESKWYKGDFHTHTIYSDGQMSREENIVSAKNQQLDFFVATDHNIVPTSWVADDSILVIPGIEVTAPLGHFNILNTNTSPFVTNKLTDMLHEEGMNAIVEGDYGNALISINHPFLTEWKWLFKETLLDNVDTLEIWNDPSYSDNIGATEIALQAWDLLLKDGHRITGIAGSDSHLRQEERYEGSEEASLIGDPGTFVYSHGLSITNIINSVKNGHVFVSRNQPIDFNCGTYIAGDQCHYQQGKVEVKVQTTDEQLVFEWIVDGEVIATEKGIESNYSFDWEKDEYHYIRINVRYEDGRLYGFTNPIYFNEKQSSITTWGQLLTQMVEEEND